MDPRPRSVVAAALLALAATAGCAGGATTTSGSSSAGPSRSSGDPDRSPAGEPVRVLDWVDGDTVDTTAGRVRLLGYDTPERGDCGYEAATSVAGRLARPGSTVVLVVEAGNDDADRYDRLLRRVVADGRDVGLAMIRSGYAVARYDSRDGYPGHSLEAAYRAADAATPDRACP